MHAMILQVIPLILTLPLVLSQDRLTNFRNRRMLLLQTQQQQQHQRKHPFIIRVPYSKVVPNTGNPLFSHSIAWKAKKVAPKADETPQPQSPEMEVSQFHSQDTNGQVKFGFNAPDQMRIESRNADGTVHGTYSYVDPYGQIIKRQYWDTGAGFHVLSNTYPMNKAASEGETQPPSEYTPEVQAARDLHFQLYQQALASLLPAHGIQDILQQNNSLEIVTPSAPTAEDKVFNETATSTISNSDSVDSSTQHTVAADSDLNDNSLNSLEPNGQNGTIVIQNPEYLRISWVTENKKHHPSNRSSETDNSKHNSNLGVFNITTFTIQGSK